MSQKINTNKINSQRVLNVAMQEMAEKNQILAKLAKNSTNPIELARLAKEQSKNVRFWIAANPHTTPETLRELHETQSYSILSNLAQNKNTPIDVINKLKNCGERDIESLAKKRYEQHRQEIFKLWE